MLLLRKAEPVAPKAKSAVNSSGLRISEAHDALEREADRAADAVMSGERIPLRPLASAGTSVQRQTPPANQPDVPSGQPAAPPKPATASDALKKLGEAFLETDLGKKLTEAVKKDELVKGATDFVSTLPGAVIAGTAAAGAVAGLAAAHKGLPAQIPEIPLDVLTPGLRVKIDYEGPVDRPTKAAISFSYSPQPEKKKPKQTEAEKYRAETARMAAEQNQFRAGLKYATGSPQDLQQKAEDKALQDYVQSRYSSLSGFGGKPLVPGISTAVPSAATSTPGQAPAVQRKTGHGAGSTDAFEQEADRAADDVLAGTRPSWSFSKFSVGSRLQRKCDCGGSECEECKAETTMQRKAIDSAGPQTAPPIVNEVLRSPGEPLDSETRRFFEPRFGHDFSHVRTHKGSRESQSARAVNALAYTVGEHIVFGPGADEAATASGRRLLAHELAHTIQQTQSSGSFRVQRASADPSAIPAGLTCVTDPSPGGAAEGSLTGVSVTNGLTPQQKKQIADFFKSWAAAGGKDFIAVEGYASPDSANDSKTQQQTNWSYSCKRAEIVQAEFVRLGVPRSRVITFAHGETDQFSKGGDPNPNRRVNISRVQVSAAAQQGQPRAAAANQAPKGLSVDGKVGGGQSKVDVNQKSTTDNPLVKQPATTGKPPEEKATEKKESDKGPPERELSITFEFDLKNDWKVKPPTPPPGTASSPFLCDHGVYQLGLKWNRGIKIKEDVLELLSEPELDINFGDPLCGQNPSITTQVNLLKYTILKDVFEADLVGVLGLPDGWATGLSRFPFTGAAQIKLQATPFSLISPDFKNIKIGAFGGLGFEQGVDTPGGEEPKTKVWTVGGFIGLDYDIGPKK